jgi:hypothetical protein
MRIKGGGIEVFAIGLEDVPKRKDWIANPRATPGNQDEPVFISKRPLQPHIIEKVII